MDNPPQATNPEPQLAEVHQSLGFIERHWPIIVTAPKTVIGIVFICLGLGVVLTAGLFEIFLIPSKNAKIELLEARIKGTSTNGEISRPDLTSFSGGLATSLDGQITAGLPIGTVYILYINDARSTWILKSSTVDSDWKSAHVRGPDFNAITNPKVWFQVG